MSAMFFLPAMFFLSSVSSVSSDPLHPGRYYNGSFSPMRRVGGTEEYPDMCISDPTQAICRVTNDGLAACVATSIPCVRSSGGGWIRDGDGDYETTPYTGVVVAAGIVLIVSAVVVAVWLWRRRSAPQPDGLALEV